MRNMPDDPASSLRRLAPPRASSPRRESADAVVRTRARVPMSVRTPFVLRLRALVAALTPAFTLAFALAVASAGALADDALEGVLEVESAFVNRSGGVYELTARIRYPANADMQQALRDGVSLAFNLEVEIQRERRYWLDASVTTIALRRELTYHAVSERYVIREIGRPAGGDGAQRAFGTLDEALASLGEVDGWPIVVAPQLRAGGDYRISVRASMRRGRLPDALRLLLFWTDDWSRESDWYAWSLPR
jgi:hypothetical protein